MSKQEPVTALFSRTVKSGREKDYEAWNRKLIHMSERQSGHVMTSVVDEGDGRYLTLQRFDSHQALQTWLESPLRLKHLDELAAMTEDAPEPAEMTGLEPWFHLPGMSGTGHVPRWKMAVVTFGVIYCFILLLNTFAVPRVSNLPLPLRSALFPAIMVPLMTYVVMPRVTRLLSGWLHK